MDEPSFVGSAHAASVLRALLVAAAVAVAVAALLGKAPAAGGGMAVRAAAAPWRSAPPPPLTLKQRLECWADASKKGGTWIAAAPLYNTTAGYYGRTHYRLVPAPESSWSWQPAARCREPGRPFIRAESCSLLSGRALLVVGDSLSSEVFFSLANALAESFEQLDLTFSTDTIRVCSGTLQLDYVRNDRVSLVREVRMEGGYAHEEFPWVTRLEKKGFDFVLLNRGAHFENDTIVLRAVEEALAFAEAAAPAATIVWHTTARGQLDTDKHFDDEPLKEDLGPDELAKLPHHWGLFGAQNAAILDLIARHFPHVVVLDVAPALGLRRDHHVDGLHCVMPGPLDHVAETLLHYLPDLLEAA